jgi:hypothetical protein
MCRVIFPFLGEKWHKKSGDVPMLQVISTSVLQRYNIFERNPNLCALPNYRLLVVFRRSFVDGFVVDLGLIFTFNEKQNRQLSCENCLL